MENLIVDHRKGDTWDGFSLLLEEYDTDGVTLIPINLTGVNVLIQFKSHYNSAISFEFKTSDSTITIPNPLNGEILMMPRIIDVPANTYMFDVQLTYTNGTVQTIVSDYFKIYSDISR